MPHTEPDTPDGVPEIPPPGTPGPDIDPSGAPKEAPQLDPDGGEPEQTPPYG